MKARDAQTAVSRSSAHQLKSKDKKDCPNCAVAQQKAQEGVLQRKVLGQTAEMKTWNLAERHATGNTVLGFTPPWINNLVVQGATTEQNVADAVNQPTINVAAQDNRFAAR